MKYHLQHQTEQGDDRAVVDVGGEEDVIGAATVPVADQHHHQASSLDSTSDIAKFQLGMVDFEKRKIAAAAPSSSFVINKYY